MPIRSRWLDQRIRNRCLKTSSTWWPSSGIPQAYPAHTYRPTMTTPLLTEGDIARGQLPDLTTVINCQRWSRLPGTDVEVRAFTDMPFVLRYRSARVP